MYKIYPPVYYRIYDNRLADKLSKEKEKIINNNKYRYNSFKTGCLAMIKLVGTMYI